MNKSCVECCLVVEDRRCVYTQALGIALCFKVFHCAWKIVENHYYHNFILAADVENVYFL